MYWYYSIPYTSIYWSILDIYIYIYQYTVYIKEQGTIIGNHEGIIRDTIREPQGNHKGASGAASQAVAPPPPGPQQASTAGSAAWPTAGAAAWPARSAAWPAPAAASAACADGGHGSPLEETVVAWPPSACSRRRHWAICFRRYCRSLATLASKTVSFASISSIAFRPSTTMCAERRSQPNDRGVPGPIKGFAAPLNLEAYNGCVESSRVEWSRAESSRVESSRVERSRRMEKNTNRIESSGVESS